MPREINNSDDIFFSIVVPTYNRAHLVVKTLHTLQNQDYKNYEIIVVDDGSTDNTNEVVNNLNDNRIVYVKKANEERAAARNFGAGIAKGKYLNFFDSDDLALTNHLSEAINVINKYHFPEWFYLTYTSAGASGKILRKQNKFTVDTLNKKLAKGNLIGCNGVFVRKDIFLLHQFNEDRMLAASEDFELWCRLAARFPLHYSNVLTSLLVEHDMRSVNQITGDQLIIRINKLIYHLAQDEKVCEYFTKDLSIKMHLYFYVSLHLSEHPSFKQKSIQYIFKAVTQSATSVTKKIFYTILRNLIFRW